MGACPPIIFPPVDFSLTEDQDRLREAVRDFARREVAPHAARWDREAAFPAETFRALAGLGLLGVRVPEAYGGAGLGPVETALVVEEIAAADASLAVLYSVHATLVCSVLVRHAPEDVRRAALPDLASGKRIGCYALQNGFFPCFQTHLPYIPNGDDLL